MKYLLILLLLVGCCPEPPSVPEDAPSAETPSINAAEIKFLDGDTFLYKGESVRLLGCDTPEVQNPHHNGAQEPWGTQALEFAWQHLREAKHVEVKYAATNDRYGRRLAHLVLDGVPLAVCLIEAGLAYENVGHFGDNGFPEYAKLILEAKGPKPEFEEPWKWRRKHRR